MENIGIELLIKVKVKTGISNTMDVTEDDLLWITKEDSDQSDTDEDDDGVTEHADHSGWDHDGKISEGE